MKFSYLFILLVFSSRIFAQDILSSNTSIESCLDQKDCLTINKASYLFYDETKNELALKVDFSNFRTEEDTTDNWINDMIDTILFYKAILNKEDFPELSNQNVKTMKLNGKIFYNNTWRDQPVQITIFPTENSIVPGSTGNFKYDNYKINFNIPFVPKDFKAYKKLYYTNQTVSIGVTLGRINLLKPGMESHLKEIYYQTPR